jgi:hypothetical protein
MSRVNSFSSFGGMLDRRIIRWRDETGIQWRVCSILAPTDKADVFITLMNAERPTQLAQAIYYSNGSWSELMIYNPEIEPQTAE